MKILVFIENNQNGGLDTFCSSLINNWPNKKDLFIIVCNSSHPGSKVLQKSIIDNCRFYFHNIPLSWVYSKKIFFFLPNSINRIIQPILRFIFYPFQTRLIRKIMINNEADELMVINGGYPGGETCRVASIVWKSLGRKPGIHNYHNFAVTPRFGLGWYENWLDRKVAKSTKLFVSVSRACSDSLHQRKMFETLDNNRYVYNGVEDSDSLLNHNTIDLRKKFKIGDSPLCLMLGNYETRKGHKFIFEVFNEVLKELPNAHLITCGGGTNNQISKVNALKNKILPSDQVHILGFIPNGASLISQSDLLLIGSQEFESFGLTAVEAMIRSVPVISTDIGGLPEVVGRDESCGYVIDHNDKIKYSKKVIDTLKDKQLRMSLGSSGKKRASELFNVAEMSQTYYEFLRE